MIGALDLRPDGRRLALALLGKLLARPPAGSSRRQKILVVRPDHLGDLLFLTPALRRLRQAFPSAEIVGLIGPWGKPVLERNPYLSRLICWEFPWFDRQPRRSVLGPYWSLIQLARRLQRERFDLALEFRPDFWWGALAVRLAGVPEHLGFAVPAVRPFLTHAVPILHGRHAVEENLRLVEEIIGRPPVDALAPRLASTATSPRLVFHQENALEFSVSDAERGRARELLGAATGGRRLVALQTGAGSPVKLWPLDRLAQVGRELRDRFGVVIIALGGPAERARVQELVRQLGPATIGLAGVTTLGELAAVLERCALALGPDSGPLHLAVAVGTPTVHLFGPADWRRFGPYGDPRRHRVIHSPWPCCPCNRLDFPAGDLVEHRCMAEIPAAVVVQVASELLQTVEPRRPGREGRLP